MCCTGLQICQVLSVPQLLHRGGGGERQNDDDNNNKNNTSQCVEQLLVHTYWLHRSNTAGHLLPCYLKMYILTTISEHQNHTTADKFAKL